MCLCMQVLLCVFHDFHVHIVSLHAFHSVCVCCCVSVHLIVFVCVPSISVFNCVFLSSGSSVFHCMYMHGFVFPCR